MTDNATTAAPASPRQATPRPPRSKPPALRAPNRKFPYRTLREMLLAWRWGLVRLAIGLVLLVLVVGRARPFAEGLVAEQLASGAVSAGRVLLRGAQQVVTAQMTEFLPADDIEAYLTAPANLAEVVTAAAFEVTPVEIVSVSLDSRGIINRFGCIVDHEQRRYQVEYDLERNVTIPTLLETPASK